MRDTEELSYFFGILALLLFITGNAYYPARLIAMKFRPWSQETILFFRKYLKAHMVLNLVAILAVALHAHYAEESNILLFGCFAVTIWLTIAGMLMYHRVLPGMKRQIRLLHTQQTLFLIWLLLILTGHLFT